MLFNRVFHNQSISLLGISLSISLLTLPMYFYAEKWQQLERETQKRLSGTITRIKSVFSGDKKYMILSAYYRQNHYHPIYALRSSFSLLIQIPFFIAAYSFLVNNEILQGVSFLIISDLSLPDKLINGQVNLLPFLMTFINCISCIIYTKGFPVKEKIQLYGIAAVFLVLLYNSPAGLVIYWTMNNVFSLIKNILQKNKYAHKLIYITICIIVLFLDIYALFFHRGIILKRAIFILAISTLFFIPLILKVFSYINAKIEYRILRISAKSLNKFFIPALVCLFLLAGTVIPVSLIAGSIQEFSYIGNYSSPFPIILTVIFQAAGIFLLWPLCIYYIFSKKIKFYLTAFTVFTLFSMLINVFLFPGSYGFLTNTLILSDPGTWLSHIPLALINLISIAALMLLLLFLLAVPKGRNILFSVEIITLIALLSFGIVNLFIINREYLELSEMQSNEDGSANLTPIYHLSDSGKNVIIIMLDNAISCLCPSIFEEKPELNKSWTGFTWYPNCVSFGGCTLYGLPSLLGGYFYSPLNMQRNPNSLTLKITEAVMLLPKIFTDSGYKTVTTDSWTGMGGGPDLHIYDSYPDISGKNISSLYTSTWMRNHPGVNIFSISDILNERLIRVSLFRMSILILRQYIYDRGNWLTVNDGHQQRIEHKITQDIIGRYAALDFLPELTKIDSDNTGYLIIACNMLTHDPVYLQYPHYIPVTDITDRGDGVFADQPNYHVNMAAYLLLGKWFEYLKKNNVYDNSRIIIASDHGSNININPESFVLPDGSRLERFNSLLLIKDFNSNGSLLINNAFMTQADVPHIALRGIVDDPVNPFTGSPLLIEKENDVYITNSIRNNVSKHGKTAYIINKNEWLSIRDNVFDPGNWKYAD